MSEMVERVMRAICKSRTCEGGLCCQWPGNRGRTECPVKAGGYTDAARSAIASMRIPTDEMMAAALKADPRFQWDVMIRAALGEKI